MIDTEGLAPSLTRYYKSGERVEIKTKWGETFRCYVGKSTGWKPVYLIIKRSDSTGGAAITESEIDSVQGVGRYK